MGARLARTIAVTLAVAASAVAAASAQAQAYNETQNWLNAFGRTVDHLTAPNRSVQNAVISVQRYLALIGEFDRLADRSVQQAGAWPWNGDVDRGGYDRKGDWTGTKIEFEFDNDRGQSLAATLWAPSDAMLAQRGLSAPLPGVVYAGGILSSQPMYYWFAQEMARNGYVVMTHDVSGQGRSEGTTTGDNTQDLRNAIDFFLSTPDKPYRRTSDLPYNPLHAMLDRSRIGTAGHSLGASAVQAVGSYGGVVDAVSAHSDLRADYAQNPDAVPIQGQGADYESFIFPPQPSPGSDPQGKLGGYRAVRDAGIDVQEVVIESGTHLAWAHVTWAYTSSWSEQVAFHYALAWFDRYLYGDMARGGRTGTQRLTQVFAADAAGHGVSRKFHSAYALDGRRCENMRAC